LIFLVKPTPHCGIKSIIDCIDRRWSLLQEVISPSSDQILVLEQSAGVDRLMPWRVNHDRASKRSQVLDERTKVWVLVHTTNKEIMHHHLPVGWSFPTHLKWGVFPLPSDKRLEARPAQIEV